MTVMSLCEHCLPACLPMHLCVSEITEMLCEVYFVSSLEVMSPAFQLYLYALSYGGCEAVS